MPRHTCYGSRPVLWLVLSRSSGPICDYHGLLRGPLYDIFGCQCVCSNMLICDELLCAMAITCLLVCVSLLDHRMTC